MKVTSLYICPWSLNDPLCQSQSLSYLYGLAAKGYKFALITFENPRFAVAFSEIQTIRKTLASKGIYWYPVRYHQGLSLSAKTLDNAVGFITGLRIFWKHCPQIIHSRSSLTVALALALSKICGAKFLYDADSILSEEYTDIGHWSRASKEFKVMAATENLARRAAERIIVLTDVLKQDFQKIYKVKKPIDVIPCCVSTEKFQFSVDARTRRRGELGLTDEKVFVYVGKIGSWYLVEETFDFFKTVQNEIENSKLLIVTQDSPDKFREIACLKNLAKNSLLIVTAAPAEVGEYLSASDAGLAFIKQLRSKRGSSPVKTAEYLANGLPVVVTDEIGDCSALIEREEAGAVVKSLSEKGYLKATAELRKLWADDKDLRQKCRAVADENYSLSEIGVVRYAEVYNQMLNG